MLTLKAHKREVYGKKLKNSRQAGQLPVVVYGRKMEATPLFVAAGEFKKILREAGESTMVSLEAEGQKHDALIHEVDVHPVTGEPLHADFLVIDRTKAIQVKVPLNFTGVAPAVKDLAGILVKVMHEVEVETLPLNIPHELVVDIAALTTLESQILVKDITVPKGVTVLAEPEAVVASVTVAKEEVEAAPVDLSSIEVEKKGKKEEEVVDEAAPAGDAA